MTNGEFVGWQSPGVQLRTRTVRGEQFVHRAADPRQFDVDVTACRQLSFQAPEGTDAVALPENIARPLDVVGRIRHLELLGVQQPCGRVERGIRSFHRLGLIVQELPPTRV